jgi:hypothetical protein
MTESSPETTAPNETGDPLCLNCLQPHPPNAHWCESCGFPLGDTAAIDPLKEIYSRVWLLRKATSEKSSFIMLVGSWIVLSPTFFVYLYHLAGPNTGWFERIGSVFVVYVSGWYLHRITRNFLRNRS